MRVLRYRDLIDLVLATTSLSLFCEMEEVLALNPKQPKEDIFFDLIKLALNEYDKHYPLFLKQIIYYRGDSYEFSSNLEEVLSGIVPEQRLQLIPTAVKGYTGTDFPRPVLNRYFDYEAPYLKGATMSGDIIVHTLTRHPIITRGERQGLYLLSEGCATFNVFIDELCRQYCYYLSRLRKNLEIPNLPVSYFSGIDEVLSTLNTTLDSTYGSGLGEGDVIL